jgi:hypothetical protein
MTVPQPARGGTLAEAGADRIMVLPLYSKHGYGSKRGTTQPVLQTRVEQ